jgi:hypothetical protein
MLFGAVMAMSGQMGKGVNHLKETIKRWTSLGNYTQPILGHLILGEIYLEMATGAMKPTPVIILKNLWFILRTLPVAHRMARRHFEKVVRDAGACNMPGFLARALYDLGVLSVAEKRLSEARSYFKEALAVAEASDLFIAEKIRTELNSLEKKVDGTAQE